LADAKRQTSRKGFAMDSKTRTSGFASMERLKQRAIARLGGVAAHQKGTAHEFTPEEARDAGRKGGQRVSTDRNHMIEIGRMGGRRSAERRRMNMPTNIAPPGETQSSTITSEAERNAE
jgi:uncharacterized protein